MKRREAISGQRDTALTVKLCKLVLEIVIFSYCVDSCFNKTLYCD